MAIDKWGDKMRECLFASVCNSLHEDMPEAGQGTVEFALVTVALLAVVLGIAAMWRLFGDGVLMQHVLTSASHHVGGSIGSLADVFAY